MRQTATCSDALHSLVAALQSGVFDEAAARQIYTLGPDAATLALLAAARRIAEQDARIAEQDAQLAVLETRAGTTGVSPTTPPGSPLARSAAECRLPGEVFADPDVRRLCKRLRRTGDHIFTFLDYPQIAFDNNFAERMIRPAEDEGHRSAGRRAVGPVADPRGLDGRVETLAWDQAHAA